MKLLYENQYFSIWTKVLENIIKETNYKFKKDVTAKRCIKLIKHKKIKLSESQAQALKYSIEVQYNTNAEISQRQTNTEKLQRKSQDAVQTTNTVYEINIPEMLVQKNLRIDKGSKKGQKERSFYDRANIIKEIENNFNSFGDICKGWPKIHQNLATCEIKYVNDPKNKRRFREVLLNGFQVKDANESYNFTLKELQTTKFTGNPKQAKRNGALSVEPSVKPAKKTFPKSLVIFGFNITPQEKEVTYFFDRILELPIAGVKFKHDDKFIEVDLQHNDNISNPEKFLAELKSKLLSSKAKRFCDRFSDSRKNNLDRDSGKGSTITEENKEVVASGEDNSDAIYVMPLYDELDFDKREAPSWAERDILEGLQNM